MFCCGQPTEMPRRSYTTLLAWTTTWERMDRGANCSRLWNISFSIFPINPNLISLLSTDMYRSSWYSCWPIKGRRAATPRVDSSISVSLTPATKNRCRASRTVPKMRGQYVLGQLILTLYKIYSF